MGIRKILKILKKEFYLIVSVEAGCIVIGATSSEEEARGTVYVPIRKEVRETLRREYGIDLAGEKDRVLIREHLVEDAVSGTPHIILSLYRKVGKE
jgi:hypothetical protein